MAQLEVLPWNGKAAKKIPLSVWKPAEVVPFATQIREAFSFRMRDAAVMWKTYPALSTSPEHTATLMTTSGASYSSERPN